MATFKREVKELEQPIKKAGDHWQRCSEDVRDLRADYVSVAVTYHAHCAGSAGQ